MKRTGTVLLVAAAVATLVAGAGTASAAPSSVRPVEPKVWTNVASAATFTALTPVRVLDTRSGGGPLGSGGVRTIDLSGLVPAGATAVVMNVTGTAPTASTFVTVYPGGGALPEASNLNLLPGETRPNAVTVALSPGRTVSFYNNWGNTHVIADLAGYYAPSSGVGFTPLAPIRMLDTRFNPQPVGPGGVVTIDLSQWLPAGATAATFNLTGVDATWPTFVTAWPDDAPRPLASNLNLDPGATNPNLVTVSVGANRRVSLYNNSGNVDLIADLAGYYAPGGLSFYQVDPTRIYDSRFDVGWYGGETYTMAFSQVLPSSAQAAVFNLTGTNTTGSTFVTAWPSNAAPPNASNLNLRPGQTAPNLVTVAVGPNEFDSHGIDVYNNVGYVDLIFDLAGWFAPAS